MTRTPVRGRVCSAAGASACGLGSAGDLPNDARHARGEAAQPGCKLAPAALQQAMEIGGALHARFVLAHEMVVGRPITNVGCLLGVRCALQHISVIMSGAEEGRTASTWLEEFCHGGNSEV